MRYNSQRGVSLLLLIIAITVFAGVAIGIVTLLRARYESYPYQVQSYQAYVLANAGVEFAIRYAKENNADPTASNSFSLQPQLYIPTDGSYKDFAFGNGKFSLRYVPGCPDKLYSKGTYGTATREVNVSNFGSYLGTQGASVYMVSSQVSRTCYGAGCAGRTCWIGTTSYPCPADPYAVCWNGTNTCQCGPSCSLTPPYPQFSGDRIQISWCVPSQSAAGHQIYIEAGEDVTAGMVAATQPVALSRLGFTDNSTTLPTVNENGVPVPTPSAPWYPLNVWWIWDFTCGITGPEVQGIAQSGGYCPEKFGSGWTGCPSPSTGPYAGMGLVDCQTVSNASYNGGPAVNQFYYPTVSGWNGTSNPPNAGYPFFWNTDQTSSASTSYDWKCRPVAPCDPGVPGGSPGDPNCAWNWPPGQNPGALNLCGQLWDVNCNTQSPWPPWPWGTVNSPGQYSCFDASPTCDNSGYGLLSRSRGTCRYPLGCGNPASCPDRVRSYAANVNLNRITIETIGHLDAAVPFKMYLAFYTYVANTGDIRPIQPTVTNAFTFTVH